MAGKTLDAGRWKDAKFAGEKVVTFQEMIDLVKGKAGLIPETKAPEVYGKLGLDMEKALVAILAKNGLDKPGADPKTPIVIQSFSAESLKVLRKDHGCKLPLVCVVGVDYQWGLEVGDYKRTFGQGSAETGTHWGKLRFDKIAEGFGCHGEYITNAADIGAAIARAYASGKVGVVHVDIDPKANSEEMPKYAEFRTWYAEGTQ